MSIQLHRYIEATADIIVTLESVRSLQSIDWPNESFLIMVFSFGITITCNTIVQKVACRVQYAQNTKSFYWLVVAEGPFNIPII